MSDDATVTSTQSIDLAAFVSMRGLQFSKVVARGHHGQYFFADPNGRAARLEAAFRAADVEVRLHEFLSHLRALKYALHRAREMPGGIVTAADLGRPDPRLRPALAADALKHRMEAR